MRKLMFMFVAAALCASPAAFAAEAVVNGDFSNATGGNPDNWSVWTERGTWGSPIVNTTNCPSSGTGNCAQYDNSGFNGGLYQALQNLVVSNTYTVNVETREYGGTDTWAEVHIGTSAPVDTSDYSANMLAKWWSGAGGCNDWDHSNINQACDTYNSNQFTASQTTHYLVLKVGNGSGGLGVSWDDITVDGVLPVGDWMIY